MLAAMSGAMSIIPFSTVRKLRWLIIVFMVCAVPLTTHAISNYKTSFNTRYGTAGSRLDTCMVCHDTDPADMSFNSYGNAVLARREMGNNIATALANTESPDSDNDGSSNLTEIQARTFPGDPNDKPVTLTSFQKWQTNYFGTTTNAKAAFNVDADNDGVINLLEFALGTTPTNRASRTLPVVGRTNNHLSLTFPRSTNATGLTYTVQESTNLLTWLTVTNLTATNLPLGTVTVQGTNTIGATARRSYLRLKVSIP
jgi:hypothetical protein